MTFLCHVSRGRNQEPGDRLTPRASGSAPKATLDLTMMGTQSVVDHAPRGAPPVICPILNEVAGNPLIARICPWVREIRDEIVVDDHAQVRTRSDTYLLAP